MNWKFLVLCGLLIISILTNFHSLQQMRSWAAEKWRELAKLILTVIRLIQRSSSTLARWTFSLHHADTSIRLQWLGLRSIGLGRWTDPHLRAESRTQTRAHRWRGWPRGKGRLFGELFGKMFTHMRKKEVGPQFHTLQENTSRWIRHKCERQNSKGLHVWV